MVSKEIFIDRYIDRAKEKEKDDERQALLKEKFINKRSEEIADYLTNIPAEETGGITAVSGFYYQFLVTIEYILEMLEGKWDYVIMEHHDDVIVGKDNTIRFIQVKTSEKIKLEVTSSPASGLYTRGTKQLKTGNVKRNNSWVDKLLTNAEIAPKSMDYNTQFQLYSSYHFIKTKHYNFDIYTDNNLYSKDIPDEDHLLEAISNESFDKEGKQYVYEDNCGENIKQLLSRFYLHTGASLSDLESFKHHLCMKLNRWLFKDIGEGIGIQIDDLNMLIGYLCTKCTYKNNPELLMITRESIDEILSEIRTKSISAARKATNKHDSLIVISRVIDELVNSIEESIHSGFIKDKLYNYKEYLVSWISEGGDIKTLLERYIDGTTKTTIYSQLSDIDREVRLQDLFMIIMFIVIGREAELSFAKNNSLLSKQCDSTNNMFSFLSLEKKKKLAVGLSKLDLIIKDSELEEQLFLLDKELHIVIQNYNDLSFINSKQWELNIDKSIRSNEIDDEAKLNKVPMRANIIPGELLKSEFLTYADEDDDFLGNIKDVWMKFQKGVS
jgi:hypothetical protein